MKDKLNKILRICLIAVLCVIMTLAFLLSAISYTFHRSAFSRDFFADILSSDEYVEQVKLNIGDLLLGDSLYYGIPLDDLNSVINSENLRAASSDYADNLYDYFTSGKELAIKPFCYDEFKNVALKFLAANNETDLQIADEIATGVSTEVSERINSVSIDVVLKIVESVVYKNKLIAKSEGMYFIFFAVGIASLVALYFIFKGTWLYRAYSLSCAFWVASAILFVPTMMFKYYDLPSRLILEMSPAAVFVNSSIYKVTDIMFTVSIIPFIIATVALICSAIYYSFKVDKK